jgi:ribosomal protein L13
LKAEEVGIELENENEKKRTKLVAPFEIIKQTESGMESRRRPVETYKLPIERMLGTFKVHRVSTITTERS